MKMKRASCAIFLVVLLCALAHGSLEVNGMAPFELFLADDGVTKSLEIHEKSVWIHHRKELIEKKRTVKDINFSMPQAVSDCIKSTSFTKKTNHKAINLDVFPPRVRAAFLGCLREKDMFQLSAPETTFEQWFIKCIELIFSQPTSNKRFILSDSSQAIISVPSQAIAPVVSCPVMASSSEKALGEARTSFIFGPEPNHLLAATRSKISSSADALDDKYGVSNMISSTQPHESSMHFPSSQPSEHLPPRKGRLLQQASSEEDEVMQVILVACAITAIGTFASVGLIFFCCLRENSETIDFGVAVRDGRPLLNLSMTDTTGGPSQMSSSLSSFNDKDSMACMTKNPSSINNFSMKHNALSMVEESSVDETTGAPVLPLPPGRSVPAPSPAPAPPPPGPPPMPPGPRAPPMPPARGARPPPMPPPKGARPSPLGPHRQGNSVGSGNKDETTGETGAPKTKLKPFFWDKVLASDDHSMVWHELQAGSFQFNEEMIESLFGYSGMENKNDKKKTPALEVKTKFIQIIDPRKAQNLSILLRALNISTEEVIDALNEGNVLPAELLQTLLKIAPTTDEELKLRLFAGDPNDLGPAERFLKVVVGIPSAFKRVEALLFMGSLQEEVTNMKECFVTLEVACDKLRNSRLFLKLLEAVLKTGNRMNDGTYRGGAQAFKLDTLLKLSDVKGTDGKTTLLHFVVQEIIRSEGIRALRAAKLNKTLSSVTSVDSDQDHTPDVEDEYRDLGLEVISSLSGELQDVKKAAAIDADILAATVSKMGGSLAKNRNFLNSELKTDDEDNEFSRSLSNFVERADADIKFLAVEEERIMALVKSTADYFHGTAGTKEGLRLFSIVKDFLVMLDRVCKEVKDTRANSVKPVKKVIIPASASADKQHRSSSENRQPVEEMHKRLFPAIVDRRKDDWSSGSDSNSDSD